MKASNKSIKNIDFSPGKIIFDDLCIQENLAIKKQLSRLKEDLLQVEFSNNLILDLGWYPSFRSNGKFQIRVIDNFDWEQPKFYAEASSLDTLHTLLLEAIAVCRKLGATAQN